MLGEEGKSVDALYHWRYFDTGIGIDMAHPSHVPLHGILVARQRWWVVERCTLSSATSVSDGGISSRQSTNESQDGGVPGVYSPPSL